MTGCRVDSVKNDVRVVCVVYSMLVELCSAIDGQLLSAADSHLN